LVLEDIVARCATFSEPFLSNQVVALHRRPAELGGGDERFAPIACVPLALRGVRGVILVDNAYNRRVIAPAELRSLATLANLAAVAIENGRLHARLKEMAAVDGLTGVLNRRRYEERLAEETERAKRSHRGLGLMVIDIDHFKQCNDRFGHEHGDAVLKEVAALLARRMRREDVLARYGGEEFVVVLTSGPPAEEALGIARKLVEQVAATAFGDRPAGELTISVGVASVSHEALEGGQLFALADAALYQAKRDGRNRAALAGTQGVGVAARELSPLVEV
jgi:diguanylate cyclase (GGDEF)-like protein